MANPNSPDETTPAQRALQAALAATGGAVGGIFGGPLGGALGAAASHTLIQVARYRMTLADETASRAAEVAGGNERLAEALESDERLAMVLLNALDTAARTSLASKRRVLGRAIGQAAIDPAQIDTAQLREAALRDLDAPHLQTLARIRDADQQAKDRLGHDNYRKQEQAPDEVRKAGQQAPTAVIRGLDRHGLVKMSATIGGGDIVMGITQEGTTLLHELQHETPPH